MKQLTIRGIDDKLHTALKREAQNQGMSINQYVVKILRGATYKLESTDKAATFHDLDFLAGTWDDAAYEEFNHSFTEQRQMDESL